MTRLLFILVFIIAAMGTIGFVMLGAFPQHLTRTPVEHSVPADKLGHN